MGTWTIPYDKLDPEQRSLVDYIARNNRNIWIGGYAGSGKSVVLADAAKYIHKKDPDSRIAIVLYTNSLVNMFKTGLSDMDCRDISVQTIYSFMHGGESYDYIFCDEVQDFTLRMLDTVRDRCRKQVIMAGDKFQSIYEEDACYGEPTVDNRTLVSTMSAESRSLNRIYRLTPTIIKAVNAFVPEMGIMTANKPLQKQDALITICKASSRGQEASWTYSKVEREVRNGYRTAILFLRRSDCVEFVNDVFRSKGLSAWTLKNDSYNRINFDGLNNAMKNAGLKMMYVGSGFGDLSYAQKNGLAVLTTYFSAKGLDFDNVYLPFSDSRTIWGSGKIKIAYMVAMTRSGQNLTISYTGMPNSFVAMFNTNGLCNEVSASSVGSMPSISSNDDDFDF